MTFTRAIVRPPSATLAEGLTTAGLGPPDLSAAPVQHAAYVAALEAFFPSPAAITAPGTVDGGDVCEAGDHVFIGVSERTNEEGARQLAALLASRGLGTTLVDIRETPGLLHLKSGIAWLGGRTLALTEASAASPSGSRLRVRS